jgi:hypothetical protein
MTPDLAGIDDINGINPRRSAVVVFASSGTDPTAPARPVDRGDGYYTRQHKARSQRRCPGCLQALRRHHDLLERLNGQRSPCESPASVTISDYCQATGLISWRHACSGLTGSGYITGVTAGGATAIRRVGRRRCSGCGVVGAIPKTAIVSGERG